MAHDIEIHAIVLRVTNYRESDRILTLLSPEMGKVTATARGSRKQNSKLLACAQPFVCAQVLLKQHLGQWIISQAEIVEAFYDLRLDYDMLKVAGAICGLAESALLTEATAHPGQEISLYELVYKTLAYACYGTLNARTLLLWYALHLLDAMGYRLALSACAACGRVYKSSPQTVSVIFDALRGGIICSRCHVELSQGNQTVRLEREALETLQEMQVCTLENAADVAEGCCDALAHMLQVALGALAGIRIKRLDV